MWWRGHTVTGTRRKCWSSDPAFPGDIHVLPFSTCACESQPPGWSHESYPHLHRKEEGSEWCLPWNIQSSPPFLSSNPRAHHLGKPLLPSRLVRCGDTKQPLPHSRKYFYSSLAVGSLTALRGGGCDRSAFKDTQRDWTICLRLHS